MPWTVDKSNADFSMWDDLTQAEQNHWDEFQNAIANEGMHPKDAASTWDSNYKCLQGDQYQIRLSRGSRATFQVDTDGQIVTVLQVGGHT